MEKVSIIIAVYNGKSYLDNTVQCCLKQSYPEIEIILVNDSSTDGSEKIIEKYLTYSNVKYIVNKKNQGACKSFNKGISVATGEYILVLGQDDIIGELYIENMLKYFQDDIGFVFCNPQRMDENGKLKDNIYLMEDAQRLFNDLSYHIAKNNVIPSTGLIMKRDLLQLCGGYEEKYKNYGEWKLWIRMLEYSKAKFIADESSFYRVHSQNLTSTFKDKSQQMKNIELQKFWLECQREAILRLKFVWYKKIFLIIRYWMKHMKFVIEQRGVDENEDNG